MTDCDECLHAAEHPLMEIYHSGCLGCAARSLAQSPSYHASMMVRTFRTDYMSALKALAGDDWDELHREVKRWDALILDARAKA